MTFKEADEAARRCLPIEHKGIEYARICSIGYRYDRSGRRFEFIELQSKNGNSTTSAAPGAVQLKEDHNERP